MEEKDLHTAVCVYTTRMEAQCASICVDFLQNRITSCRHIENAGRVSSSTMFSAVSVLGMSLFPGLLRLDIQLIQLV